LGRKGDERLRKQDPAIHGRHRCGGCKNFLEGKDGTLRVTGGQRIADTPLFGALLPESFGWPEGCCLCDKPATRRESISATLPTSAGKNAAVTVVSGGLVSLTGGGTKVTVEVPHCPDHREGALLGAASGRSLRIRFRS